MKTTFALAALFAANASAITLRVATESFKSTLATDEQVNKYETISVSRANNGQIQAINS